MAFCMDQAIILFCKLATSNCFSLSLTHPSSYATHCGSVLFLNVGRKDCARAVWKLGGRTHTSFFPRQALMGICGVTPTLYSCTHARHPCPPIALIRGDLPTACRVSRLPSPPLQSMARPSFQHIKACIEHQGWTWPRRAHSTEQPVLLQPP